MPIRPQWRMRLMRPNRSCSIIREKKRSTFCSGSTRRRTKTSCIADRSSSRVRSSSTLERVPELLDLLWGQLLAAAHKAQHLFALDLTLPFARGLRSHPLAIDLTVEELGQDFKARIGGGGVARENRRDDQKGLQGAAPSVPASPAGLDPSCGAGS